MSNPNYSTGQVIDRRTYNEFSNGSVDGTLSNGTASVGLVWGTGYGRYGYGQGTEYIAPVTIGQLIRSQEWDNLDAILQSTIEHQHGIGSYIGPGGGVIAAGQLIQPLSHFDSYITTAFNDAGIVYSKSDSIASTTSYTGLWGSSGARTLSFVQTITFASADQARYYFNAGGTIKLSFAHNGGTTRRDIFWDSICAAAGVVEIGYLNTRKIGGSGSTSRYSALNSNNGGFWNNTGSYSQHFRQLSISGYGGYGGYGGYDYSYPPIPPGDDDVDQLNVSVSVSGDTGVNSGIGNIITIKTDFVNTFVRTPVDQDIIHGTTQVSVVFGAPWTNFITQTWGSPNLIGTASAL